MGGLNKTLILKITLIHNELNVNFYFTMYFYLIFLNLNWDMIFSRLITFKIIK
jgi:hypothetical protein